MLILEILKVKEEWYIDKETYRVLASVRMERAIELVDEAKELLQNERYKSANNRAFYAMEKI